MDLNLIKSKLKAAAFDNGNVNWHKIFRTRDKGKTGEISLDGFRLLIRKDAKVGLDVLSEQQLVLMFKHVDKDGGGSVNYDTEFLGWLDPDGNDSPTKPAPEHWGSMKDFILQATGKSGGVREAKAELKRKKDLAKAQRVDRAVVKVKKKLRAAAFYKGKTDWNKMFRQYDRDNSGSIRFDEFRSAIRKNAGVTAEMVSEYELRQVFNLVDKDKDGDINYETEFLPWLEEELPELEDIDANSDLDEKTYRVEEIALLSQANRSFIKARVCLPVIIRWMNHLLSLTSVDDPDCMRMTVDNFIDEMRDGIHLLHVVRTLCVTAHFGTGLYDRPVSRPMCESNLERALSAAARHGLNMSHLCRPRDFYEGRILQIARCLVAIFEALQMRPVKRRIKLVLREMDAVLAPLGRPLLDQTLQSPSQNGHYVLTDFADGTRIMALLVISGHAQQSDMAKLYGNPTSEERLLENVDILTDTLKRANLPVLLEKVEWNHPPFYNFDFIFLQLYLLWIAIRERCMQAAGHHDLAAFRFKDDTPLRLTTVQIRHLAEKGLQAQKDGQDMEEDRAPHSKVPKRFVKFVSGLEGGTDGLWSAMDPGDSGAVSKKDFCRVLINLRCKMVLDRLFKAIDANKNGHVSKVEIKNFLELGYGQPAQKFSDFEMEMMALRKPKEAKRVEARLKTFGKKTRDLVTTNCVLEFVAILDSLGGVDAAFPQFSIIGVTITATEFMDSCRRLGFVGDAKYVFQQMDLDRGGTIAKEEFYDLYNSFKKSMVEQEEFSLEMLVDVPMEIGDPWPEPSMPIFFLEEEMGEARMPGVAEERRSLFQEDLQRQSEIAASGASSTAQKVLESAQGASATVADVDADESGNFHESVGRLIIQAESSPGLVTAGGPAPTTSLDARVVLTDETERCMWLQTSVVDRTGQGSENLDDAAFVLELRDQRSINSFLHAQIDVSLIRSIEQLGPASDLLDPDAHASFVVTASQGADLGGSASVDKDSADLWDVCHVGAGGVLTLYIVAGPSRWNRREAVRFFDELRIMVHFLASGVSAPIEPEPAPAPAPAPAPTPVAEVTSPPKRKSLLGADAIGFGAQASSPARGRLSLLLGRG